MDPQNTESTDNTKQILRFLFELGPIVVFFLANYFSGYNFIVATSAIMIATTLSLILSWIFLKKIPIMPLVGGVLIMIFGGLTLYLNDQHYKQIQPTVVNLLFASILSAGLFFNKLFLKTVLEEAFKITDDGWRKLTLRWIGFFIFLALLNEVIWRNFSWAVWSDFKVFGIMPITLIFTVFQIGLIQKYALEDSPPQNIENKS